MAESIRHRDKWGNSVWVDRVVPDSDGDLDSTPDLEIARRRWALITIDVSGDECVRMVQQPLASYL